MYQLRMVLQASVKRHDWINSENMYAIKKHLILCSKNRLNWIIVAVISQRAPNRISIYVQRFLIVIISLKVCFSFASIHLICKNILKKELSCKKKVHRGKMCFNDFQHFTKNTECVRWCFVLPTQHLSWEN